MKKRFLSMLLAIVMVVGMLPGFTLTASAASNVEYVDAKGVAQTPVTATDISESTTSWSNGWYYASGEVTISSRVTVSGTVNLILGDGATLKAADGIAVVSGNSLTIWGQTNGTGRLEATSTNRRAGIGGNGQNENRTAGTITINGGVVYASSAERGAGIGGGAPGNFNNVYGGSGGTITINGGNVTAIGGSGGAGIGGGWSRGAGGIVKITGGTVTATGGDTAAGIGGGGSGRYSNINGGPAGTIIIEGGNVTVTGGNDAPGIGAGRRATGGSIKITGGVVTAQTIGGTNATTCVVDSIEVSGCPIIVSTGYKHNQSEWTSGILYTSTAQYAFGSVFGNPTLNQDVTIPNGKTLNIPAGSTLTIPEGFTFRVGDWGYLFNRGTIINNGTLSTWMISNDGAITNNGTFQVNSNHTSYNFTNNGTITNGENGIIKSSNRPLTGTGTVVNGIKFSLTGLTAEPSSTTLTHNNTDYTTTLTADADFVLPETITVNIGGQPFTGHGYASANPTITIPAANIKGNIEIIAEGVRVYTISFDANGGSCATTSAQAIGGKLTSLPEASRTGYRFDGWYDDGQKVDIDTEYTADTTLTAKWIPETGTAYTVKHLWQNLSDDGYTLHESEPMYGETDSQTSAAAKNYPGFTAQAITQTTITPDGLAVVEIRYDRNTYAVTFDSNGGVGSMEQQKFIYGDTIELSANQFTHDGYTFIGWNTEANGSGTAYTDIERITLNGDVTLYAQWTKNDSGFDSDLWYWMLLMLYNQEFDITATATDGGTITPDGISKVKYDKNITYTITPAEGYMVADVLVDGESVGAVTEYTFKRVKKDHSITAFFAEIPWENPYSDVSESDWFYEDVRFVDENGLMNGTVENEVFAPDLTATRAMIVTILWRLEGAPIVDSPVGFFDVPENEWYTDAVNWASANGIVLGYDGLFNPENPITREQLAAILHRYAAYKGWNDGVIFPMIPQYDYSEWAENDVIWADMNGLLDGIGSDMTDMTADASRAEVAAMLRRFCNSILNNK